MAETISEKVKRQLCKQQKCLSGNKDTSQVVVLATKGQNKNGLMCSQCLLDTELLEQLHPIEMHVLPIRKFVYFLQETYDRLSTQKPIHLKQKQRSLLNKLSQMQAQIVGAVLQIIRFVEESSKKTLQELKKIHNDEDIMEIIHTLRTQRLWQNTLQKQLKRLCLRLKYDGTLSSDSIVAAQSQKITVEYTKRMEKAKKALQQIAKSVQSNMQFLNQ